MTIPILHACTNRASLEGVFDEGIFVIGVICPAAETLVGINIRESPSRSKCSGNVEGEAGFRYVTLHEEKA